MSPETFNVNNMNRNQNTDKHVPHSQKGILATVVGLAILIQSTPCLNGISIMLMTIARST